MRQREHLVHIERHLPIAPTPTDDMVSSGRCMLMRLSVALPPRNAVVSQIVAHWQSVEREINFARFAEACRQDAPNCNKVIEELRALTGTGGERLDAEGNGGLRLQPFGYRQSTSGMRRLRDYEQMRLVAPVCGSHPAFGFWSQSKDVTPCIATIQSSRENGVRACV